MRYKMQKEQFGLYIVYQGEITFRDILSCNHEVLVQNYFERIRYMLVDFAQITSLNLSTADIWKIAHDIKSISVWNTRIDLIYVVRGCDEHLIWELNKITRALDLRWSVKVCNHLEIAREILYHRFHDSFNLTDTLKIG